MADIEVNVQLPNGEVKQVELPDDVPARELLPEMVTQLRVPVTGADGRPVTYRLDSKALGRVIGEDETLGSVLGPAESSLILSPVITAGLPGPQPTRSQAGKPEREGFSGWASWLAWMIENFPLRWKGLSSTLDGEISSPVPREAGGSKGGGFRKARPRKQRSSGTEGPTTVKTWLLLFLILVALVASLILLGKGVPRGTPGYDMLAAILAIGAGVLATWVIADHFAWGQNQSDLAALGREVERQRKVLWNVKSSLELVKTEVPQTRGAQRIIYAERCKAAAQRLEDTCGWCQNTLLTIDALAHRKLSACLWAGLKRPLTRAKQSLEGSKKL